MPSFFAGSSSMAVMRSQNGLVTASYFSILPFFQYRRSNSSAGIGFDM